MLWPRFEGEFEQWDTLESTLTPLLKDQVGRLFLPWTLANAAAIEKSKDEFKVDFDDEPWTQKPQKYHAKSLIKLQSRYADIADKSVLDPILQEAGCLAAFRREP